ncbi:MAG: response regulator [Candidatus Thiodiazotropha sp.]
MSNILAVDDQSTIRVLMREALTRLGHRVTLACSGMEAIKLCRKHRYDLVILDYRMPGMNGLDVVKYLKGRVRFVLHTSDYDNWALQLQAICFGALGVIAKISDISAFQCSVDAFLNDSVSRSKPVPFEHFPLFQNMDKRPDSGRWLAEDENYGAACARGREYAAYLALYLKANPSLAGSNIINQIVTEMVFFDDSSAKGYRVGFFSFLELMIYQFSCDHEVCSYLDDINEAYLVAERARAEARSKQDT